MFIRRCVVKQRHSNSVERRGAGWPSPNSWPTDLKPTCKTEEQDSFP
jgi:hypothetical protein